MTPIARLWPGATVVCLAGGPSLTVADVDACRDRARVIAVNDAYRLAPWADALYACDDQWWRWQRELHPAALDAFAGLRFAMKPRATKWSPGVRIVPPTGVQGLETDPAAGVRHGQNSGYQAINLAYHLGAARIVLLGYDCQLGAAGAHHWFGKHPNQKPPLVAAWRGHFPTLVAPLRAAGVEVVNCSRETALSCFPRRSLAETLAPLEACA